MIPRDSDRSTDVLLPSRCARPLYGSAHTTKTRVPSRESSRIFHSQNKPDGWVNVLNHSSSTCLILICNGAKVCLLNKVTGTSGFGQISGPEQTIDLILEYPSWGRTLLDFPITPVWPFLLQQYFRLYILQLLGEKFKSSWGSKIHSIISFHLSKRWKAKFSVQCYAIFLVRLQRKVEIDHSWKWKARTATFPRPSVVRFFRWLQASEKQTPRWVSSRKMYGIPAPNLATVWQLCNYLTMVLSTKIFFYPADLGDTLVGWNTLTHHQSPHPFL